MGEKEGNPRSRMPGESTGYCLRAHANWYFA
jgi:hypothetical protein